MDATKIIKGNFKAGSLYEFNNVAAKQEKIYERPIPTPILKRNFYSLYKLVDKDEINKFGFYAFSITSISKIRIKAPVLFFLIDYYENFIGEVLLDVNSNQWLKSSLVVIYKSSLYMVDENILGWSTCLSDMTSITSQVT